MSIDLGATSCETEPGTVVITLSEGDQTVECEFEVEENPECVVPSCEVTRIRPKRLWQGAGRVMPIPVIIVLGEDVVSPGSSIEVSFINTEDKGSSYIDVVYAWRLYSNMILAGLG